MPIQNVDLKKSSEKELEILYGVIEYADRMIYEDRNYSVLSGMSNPTDFIASSQAPLYKLLRKSAYAKTIVVETEKKGVLEYRLSATEAVYPNFESGYCTPHSTVGRLATICHIGYEGNSKLWGEFRVTEVRSFDRFGGPEFEPNVRNFLRMQINCDDGRETVQDLKSFLADYLAKKVNVESKNLPIEKTILDEKSSGPDGQSTARTVPEKLLHPELIIAKFSVVDEAEGADLDIIIDDEHDSSYEGVLVKQEEYYGLSEHFFTHQTIEQNQIIARSPVGAMFVEGVAGSGKTSAALGRTKMLTTFDANKVLSRDEFYDILGEEQDYWAADYAGQFSQESSIGFVRTGELIQYLKETCRRIDLPDLPVIEYKELQTRLLEHRLLTRSYTSGKRWTGLTEARDAHEATTFEWLRASDRAIGQYLASIWVKNLPNVNEFSELFAQDIRYKVERVASVALTAIQHELKELSEELTHPPREGVFLLDRLASRITARLDGVRKRIMGSKVIWIEIDGEILYAEDENSLAKQMISRKIPLYLRAGQRLVFVNENGPIDHSLVLLSLAGQPVPWSEEIRAAMSAGNIIVRENSDRNVYAVLSDINSLYLRLLPEATDRLYILSGNDLRRLLMERGLGRVKFPLAPASGVKADAEFEEDEIDGTSDSVVSDQVRQRTPDSEFYRLVSRRLFQPLSAIADLYLTALKIFPEYFPNQQLTKVISTQLGQFKLGEEDIDLLLCLTNVIGRGMKNGGLKQLHEPNFYQSVFVDEVQDFTEQQVYLMVEQANPRYRAVTVVGDTAQKLHHGTSINLRSCFPGQALSHVCLSENLRQAETPGLALFSACFRAALQGGIAPPAKLIVKAREQKDSLARPKFIICDMEGEIDDKIIEKLLEVKVNQTVAVLFPDHISATTGYQRLEPRLREYMINAEFSERMNLARRHIRHFSYVAKAKGLEFDVVILANVDRYDLSDVAQINRLYVGITRARKNLILLQGKKNLGYEFNKIVERYHELIASSDAM